MSVALGESHYAAWHGSARGAGDANGDGIDDFVVGAPGYGQPLQSGEKFESGPGKAYLVYGSRAGYGSGGEFDLESMRADQGVHVLSPHEEAALGNEVTGVGDANGDGLDDIVVSAHRFPAKDEGAGGRGGPARRIGRRRSRGATMAGRRGRFPRNSVRRRPRTGCSWTGRASPRATR